MVESVRDHDSNPFEYARPLPPEQVVGRDELCDQLLRQVRERRLAALLGPRRFGKTSMLGRVAWLCEQVDTSNVVAINCYGVASIGDFVIRLERGMAGLQGAARRVVSELLGGSELRLSVKPHELGLAASVGAKGQADPTRLVHELLDTLAKVADRQDGVLFVLDEFQDAGRVDGLDAVLRTHLETARSVAVIFAGSRPSMMRQLFTDRARPFYSQAKLFEIERFNLTESARIVREGFAATGREAGDIPTRLAAATEGHPQRLMMAANAAWELVAADGTGTEDDAVAGLIHARRDAEPQLTAVIDGLDRTHRDTLRAVAMFGSPYVSAAEAALGLKAGSAQSAVRTLEADAQLERTADGWRVVDPFLAETLRTLDRDRSLGYLERIRRGGIEDRGLER